MNILETLHRIIKLHSNQELQEAEILCRKVLEVDPDNADANHFIGIIAFEVKNYEAAEQYLKRAIALNPANPSCYLNMGNVYHEKKMIDKAIQYYEKAISIAPDNYKKAYNNLGVALTSENRLDQALENLNRAIQIDPEYFEAHNNIGETYRAMGQHANAMASCKEAIRLAPEFVFARWNHSINLFLQGRLAEAWPEYEWRWKRPQTPIRKIDAGERWTGRQPLSGKTIFVYEEQGMGDTLQFMRYLPLIKNMGGVIIFEVIPPLVRLMDRAHGFDRLWLGQKNVDTRPTDRFDYHVPLLSLPGILGTTLENIPADIPYLFADPELVRIWAKKIRPDQKLKVGLVWAGHPAHLNDHNRSIRLSLFAGLKKLKNIHLYCLQKEKHSDWTDMDPGDIFEEDLGETISDFADTAAAIENLDLVISVDTAVAHLAGAMGKPVWTLLPFSPDWRWMLDREDSPWYPTMTLLRQPALGDWESVFKKINAMLTAASENH